MNELEQLGIVMRDVHQHADNCNQCLAPVADPDGSPGLPWNLCPEGLRLLDRWAEAVDVLEVAVEDH